MEKANKSVLGLMIIALVGIVAFSCTNERNDLVLQSETLLEENAKVSPLMRINPADIEYCGEITVTDLMAGQHYVAGKITVGNDEDNVYVTYTTENDWYLKAVHLFVGKLEDVPLSGGGNPQNGHFPVNVTFDPLETSVTYSFPKETLPECMIVAAHAEVVKIVDGVVVQEETGWGKGKLFPGANWSMYIDFCMQECVPPTPPEDDKCYQEETAWAFGDRYVKKGNWATYTTYEAGKTVDIFAGQNYLAGHATFSEVVDGKVTITIELIDSWMAQDVNEALKIQGYNSTPPNKNPAPGQFTTYKGELVSPVVVDAFNYYGIHIDVMKEIPCTD